MIRSTEWIGRLAWRRKVWQTVVGELEVPREARNEWRHRAAYPKEPLEGGLKLNCGSREQPIPIGVDPGSGDHVCATASVQFLALSHLRRRNHQLDSGRRNHQDDQFQKGALKLGLLAYLSQSAHLIVELICGDCEEPNSGSLTLRMRTRVLRQHLSSHRPFGRRRGTEKLKLGSNTTGIMMEVPFVADDIGDGSSSGVNWTNMPDTSKPDNKESDDATALRTLMDDTDWIHTATSKARMTWVSKGIERVVRGGAGNSRIEPGKIWMKSVRKGIERVVRVEAGTFRTESGTEGRHWESHAPAGNDVISRVTEGSSQIQQNP
ncbi:hypothetical protein CALCODRAFT_511303 [Calocera cornea HHB12733]|uniref:Uncharacterized protein n=1 Tax=Calocera cornea HHB12733 TaxID=1353952 RepID=A0A165DUU7_9BASI|nr:hypothetical protein CALCODRAFT_511303 [Calocera cornea HHB12733]